MMPAAARWASRNALAVAPAVTALAFVIATVITRRGWVLWMAILDTLLAAFVWVVLSRTVTLMAGRDAKNMLRLLQRLPQREVLLDTAAETAYRIERAVLVWRIDRCPFDSAHSTVADLAQGADASSLAWDTFTFIPGAGMLRTYESSIVRSDDRDRFRTADPEGVGASRLTLLWFNFRTRMALVSGQEIADLTAGLQRARPVDEVTGETDE